MARSLVSRDVRGFVDPLGSVSDHAEIAHAIASREPFRDLILPLDVGMGTRLMRIFGYPRFDANGAYIGYRGVAVPAAAPNDAVEQMPPQLRQRLANALGLIVGFGRFLQQDLSAERHHMEYLARLLAAAGTACNVVAAAPGASSSPPQVATDPPKRGTTSASARQRILLVHEMPEIADLFAIAFERAGFETAVCREAAEALDVLLKKKTTWDVLVTTASAASLDEVSLVGYAKEVHPDTLCVVCDEPDRAVLAQAEADICWPWPVDAIGLAKVVKAELSVRSEVHAANAAASADVCCGAAWSSTMPRSP